MLETRKAVVLTCRRAREVSRAGEGPDPPRAQARPGQARAHRELQGGVEGFLGDACLHQVCGGCEEVLVEEDAQAVGVVGVEAGLLHVRLPQPLVDAVDEQGQAPPHDGLAAARADEGIEVVLGGHRALGNQQPGAGDVDVEEGQFEGGAAVLVAGVGVGSQSELPGQLLLVRLGGCPQQVGAVVVANGCRQLGVHDAQLCAVDV